MRRISFISLLIAAFWLSACSGGSGISIVDAWARPAEVGQNSVVYFQLFNGSSENEVLLSAEANLARAIEIHETMAMEMGNSDELDGMVDSANGGMEMEAMQMVPQERVNVSAGETIIFAPGGLHVMLVDLNQSLQVGDEFSLTLNFESGQSLLVNVEVKEP